MGGGDDNVQKYQVGPKKREVEMKPLAHNEDSLLYEKTTVKTPYTERIPEVLEWQLQPLL